tara:strand:- start:1100 stop:1207 length:108 start_codon:yes stop_codon:yes gene_type:complete
MDMVCFVIGGAFFFLLFLQQMGEMWMYEEKGGKWK